MELKIALFACLKLLKNSKNLINSIIIKTKMSVILELNLRV
jgi:hypothetical protein